MLEGTRLGGAPRGGRPASRPFRAEDFAAGDFGVSLSISLTFIIACSALAGTRAAARRGSRFAGPVVGASHPQLTDEETPMVEQQP
eukprot:CAMPEP_0170270612 /NCGR_PEP_ID=MMETSP0116_2-20130129/35253_1 /TAXON_ID=400756 /ORGANISM="Durinskia baltica, Strain CSIRO CS-38" /LENGTH=85 /DNA_ID=CAMNT_0010521809 /DNA_START=42 /DNA_END=299 /DNA_ORIENTATION=+